MELVDVYSDNGERTGKIIDKDLPYAQTLKDGEYVMAVGMWIVDRDGKIFLTRRSPEKRYAPGKWENPAGHVRAGEDPVHAVIRELREETGIEVTEGQIKLLGKSRTWPYLGRDFGVRMHVDIGDVKFQKGETDGARWVTFEEFAAMAEAGEFPPSLTDHMRDYKENFLKFIGQEGSALLSL